MMMADATAPHILVVESRAVDDPPSMAQKATAVDVRTVAAMAGGAGNVRGSAATTLFASV
jgi:hypothetical protein